MKRRHKFGHGRKKAREPYTYIQVVTETKQNGGRKCDQLCISYLFFQNCLKYICDRKVRKDRIYLLVEASIGKIWRILTHNSSTKNDTDQSLVQISTFDRFISRH